MLKETVQCIRILYGKEYNMINKKRDNGRVWKTKHLKTCNRPSSNDQKRFCRTDKVVHGRPITIFFVPISKIGFCHKYFGFSTTYK
jgi:hypothetical protein